jgi:hypothetical protein
MTLPWIEPRREEAADKEMLGDTPQLPDGVKLASILQQLRISRSILETLSLQNAYMIEQLESK